MKWKLSVGVSSSACRSLNSPYVAALVTVTDPSGAPSTKSFEMTVGEFKVRVRKTEKSSAFFSMAMGNNTLRGGHTCILIMVIRLGRVQFGL